MPRYEFSEGTSDKFWEIELEGSSFTTRYGRIGTDGQVTTKSFASPAEAKKAYDKIVAEKVKKGYQLVEGDDEEESDDEEAPSEASHPELEAAILANPDDVQAYLVFGDWLETQGDPRGELVAVQAELKTWPEKADLKKSEAALMKKHRARFLGALGDYETTKDGNDRESFTWQLGFLRTARFAFDHYANEDEDVDLAEAVRKLLEHPSGKFLYELVIGLNRGDPDCEYQGILDVIAEASSKSLRKLFVGDFEYPDEIEISWTNVGNMDAVWAALPNLESCILQGGEIGLGKVVARKLKHLEIRTGGLPKAVLESLATAELPSLETLIVWTGSENYGGSSSFEDVAPLLDGKHLPKLRHLGIMNSEYTNEVARAIGRAPILKQLEVLDLSMGTMTDEGRVALLEAKDALSHLTLLNLENNLLESTEGLEGLCAEVRCEEQRADEVDEDYRYPMVGE